MGTLCEPCGGSVVTLWGPPGNPVGNFWGLSGNPMATHLGPLWGSLWIKCMTHPLTIRTQGALAGEVVL